MHCKILIQYLYFSFIFSDSDIPTTFYIINMDTKTFWPHLITNALNDDVLTSLIDSISLILFIHRAAAPQLDVYHTIYKIDQSILPLEQEDVNRLHLGYWFWVILGFLLSRSLSVGGRFL